ncbi:MAG: hypothetical protein ACFCVK_18695 [Acidimicrobiales bacterium]
MLLEEFDASFGEAVADHGVNAIVLFGSGEHRSSGHDIGTPEEKADRVARPYGPGVQGVQQRSWDWNIENTVSRSSTTAPVTPTPACGSRTSATV